MVKNVFRTTGILRGAAPVAVGWLAFAVGMRVGADHPLTALLLLAVSRVLP
jgi:hypothetical protein